MVAARIISSHTKLATTRWWHNSTLPQAFNIEDARVDKLYGAMDWLLQRQNRIQGKLAKRLFQNDSLVMFNLTSTDFEGQRCPLAKYGDNRDGKTGKLQVNFGLLCDVRGRPTAVPVHPGNVGDTKTILPEAERLRKQFGLERVVLVGDRGMIAQTKIDALRELEIFDWISALKGKTVTKLMYDDALDRRAFRTIKTDLLNVQPIYHRNEDQVRSHIFICMLAWHVEWHMREVWRPLRFADIKINAKRDLVQPAKRSKAAAKQKAQSQLLKNSTPTHSFTTLMENLATVVQNKCHFKTPASLKIPVEFEMTTQPDKKQKQAMDLLHKVGRLSHTAPRL